MKKQNKRRSGGLRRSDRLRRSHQNNASRINHSRFSTDRTFFDAVVSVVMHVFFNSKLKRRLVSILACVMVFITTYALILPAITMTKGNQTLVCAAETHQHDDACFADIVEDGKVVGKKLVCGYAGYTIHEHGLDCYTEIDGQKVLVCELPEISAHTHGTECYENGELICEKLELHKHNTDCYEKGHDGNAAYLTCGKLELVEHTHGAACLIEAEQTDEQKIEAAEKAAEERLAKAESLESMSEYVGLDSGLVHKEAAVAAEVDETIDRIKEIAIEETSDETEIGVGEEDESSIQKDQKVSLADDSLGYLTYEDDTIKVTATPIGEEVPAGAELVVTQITPDMGVYDAYFAALNRDFDDNPYNGENSLLYDVSVMVAGKEYEPTKGKIEIKLDFKDNQLSEMLGVDLDENAPVRVIHLPLIDADNVTAIENIDESQIELEYVAETILDTDETESVSFSLDSLSVITVTGASTTITVNGSLSGTDMNDIRYNLYAYLNPVDGGKVYGAKIEFNDKQATATIPNVPVGTYKLALVYPNIKYDNNNGKLVDVRTFPTPSAENNQIFDDHFATWVYEDGGYVFGFSADMPDDQTISADNNTINFTLGTTDAQSVLSVSNLMDRAINYGITADEIEYKVGAYSNFATKVLEITNGASGGGTTYNNRADGVDVVPNVIADIQYDGQSLSSKDKPSNYYVTEDDEKKVDSKNTTDTVIRNKNEIEDRVEIMLSNTLKQAEELKNKSMMTLQSCTSVDLSPYADDATIILDATAISKESNGFTIVKRPGQTVIFNINGQDVAPPENIKILHVDKNGNTLGYYKSGTDMNTASADEKNVWNKVVWNFPDATSVTSKNTIGGIFLVPNGSFTVGDKGGGWIVARHKVTVTNEWYAFPGNDEPFKQKIIRKTFVGISKDEVRSDYVIKVWTNTNESTSGTTQDQLITTLVRKKDSDSSLIKDNSGLTDETGFLGEGTDSEGNYYIEWKTPPLSVGNEHKLTEINATSTTGKSPTLVEFKAPYSEWSSAARDYVWIQRNLRYGSESEFAGIFNVSAHNEDYRQYAYVTNYYNIVETSHNLTLKKVVSDPNNLELNGQTYHFEVRFTTQDDKPFSGTVKYQISDGEEQVVNVNDGNIELNLLAGQEAVFKELPFGTKYSIEETGIPEKCSVAFTGDTTGLSKGTGTIVTDRLVTARNTYYDGPGKGSLTIAKTVNDNTEEKDAAPTDFVFTIKNAYGHYVNRLGEETSDPNEYRFTITDRGSVKFTSWPAGRYTIEEERDRAQSSKENVRWTVTIGGDANSSGSFAIVENQESTVNLTNTYEDIGKGTLNVTKTIVDNTESHAVPTTFEFTLKNADGKYIKKNADGTYSESIEEADGLYTILKDSAVSFSQLPEGTYYIAEKDASSTDEAVSWSVVIGGDANVSGVVTVSKGGTSEVTMTNTYEDEPEFTGQGTIKIKKILSGGGSEASSKKYYVTIKAVIEGKTRYLQGLDGKIGTKPVQIEIDPNKQYTIENLPDGSYTVTEDINRAQINGYTLSTTGNAESKTLTWNQYWYSVPDFNVTNKYEEIKQDSDKAQITVNKQWFVNGENVTSSTDEESATVRLVRYRTEKTTATLHFIGSGITHEDIEIPVNKQITVTTANAIIMAANSKYKSNYTGKWPLQNGQEGYLAGDPYGSSIKSLKFYSGSNTDIYLYFLSNPGEISVSPLPESGEASVERQVMEDTLVLKQANNWEWTFYNLPLSGTENGKNYTYSYVVEEIDPATGYATTYGVDGGDFKETLTADDAVNSTTSKTIIVRNSKEVTEEKGSVQVTKTFSGIDSTQIPDDFKITASWMEDGTNKLVELTLTGDQQNGVERTGSGLSYTWTIGDLPIDTVVTFSESGYEITGHDVATTPDADSSGAVKATATAAATPGETRFTNSYTEITVPVEIIKVDLDNKHIGTGATFALYKADDVNDDGTVKTGASTIKSGTTDNNGILDLGSLKPGNYKLIETDAPEGYLKLKEAVSVIVLENRVTYMIEGSEKTAELKDSKYRISISNKPEELEGYELPSTGGPGTKLFTIIGSILVASAGILLIRRRRRV